MRYTLVEPPAPVVDVEVAKTHCHVDGSEEDALIEIYIAAATTHLDGRDGVLNRAIGEQEWLLETEGPDDDGRICIDLLGVQTVDAITYLVDGEEEDWNEAEYRIGWAGRKPFITPAEGFDWPAADEREDAFRVAFTAGYADDEGVPSPLKSAILLMVGDLYAFRESGQVGSASSQIAMTPTVDRLIGPYRDPAV